MPTQISPSEKAAFIAIVNVVDPIEASRLYSVLNEYEDVATAIGRQQDVFAGNLKYLTEAIGVFNDTELQNVGIWNNKTQSSPPLANPVMIINSTYDDITITDSSPPLSPPLYPALTILGTSYIRNIAIAGGFGIDNLYIGPGSIVDVVDASADDAVVNNVYLPFMRSTPSALNLARYGSRINAVYVSEGSYYGGIENVDPMTACLIPVTDMQATEVTKNGVLVSWTPPTDGYLFINPFYKKTNSKVWILCTEVDGEFVDETGFIFRHLESDTYYDFKAVVVCNNGGHATTEITTKTVCCGAGTQMSLYKNCLITILISSVADSPPLGQTLCNGVAIDLHYPPGPTITIPYLATVNFDVLGPMVIDNANYQLMPLNKATGTWDASTTPVLTFVEGNVITVPVSLPA